MSKPSDAATLDKKLQAVLDGDYAAIREEARAFLSQPEFLPVPAGISKEEYRKITFKRLEKMIAAGYAKKSYDPKYGGTGEALAFMNFLEIVAHQDMSFFVKQGVNFGLFGMGVAALGTDKHLSKYLPPLMNGKLFGGFAMTEVGGGSDVQNVGTTAIYDHATRSFTIDTPNPAARKAFIGNAANDGEVMIVFAQLKMSKDAPSEGVHAFVVPVRKDGKVLPGVEIEDCGDKVGLNGVDNGYIDFHNVKVPYDAMLDHFASISEKGVYQSDIPGKTARFFKMISTLVTGRIGVANAALSGGKNALTAAITYAHEREVFGSKLIDKQATQTRLFPHLADTYAMHFATRFLMEERVKEAPEVETLAAALKSRASDDAVAAIDEARRVCGGAGYISSEIYGRLRDDVDIFRTFEGDNTVLRLLVARNQLTALTKTFNGASAVPLPNLPKDADAKTLLDPAFQQQLFALHEKEGLNQLVGKVMTKMGGGDSLPKAVDKCQDDMIAYADSYAEKVMLEQFVKNVEAQNDPETKEVLKTLCNVFAVNALLKSSTWYLENGLLTTGQTKALRELAETLNEKLKPDALALVKAFAIPEAFLSVPKPAAAPAKVSKKTPRLD